MSATKKPGRPAIYPFGKLQEGVGRAVHVPVGNNVHAFFRTRGAAHTYAAKHGWKVTTKLQGADDKQYVRVQRVA